MLLDCLEAPPEDESHISVSQVLPIWAETFPGIAVSDIDRVVRSKAVSVHAFIVSKAGKELAPFLKELVPVWLLCFFDPFKVISSGSRSAFEVCSVYIDLSHFP